MILLANSSYNKQIIPLIEENKEILKIFISSIKTLNSKK